MQVARTERRIERLRASVERHDAQLSDIRSRIIWTSGGCAVVRDPHTIWNYTTAGAQAQRDVMATNRRPVSGKWPLALRVKAPVRSTVKYH